MIEIATLKAWLLTIWSYPGVSFITVGVLLNLILALAVAVRTGTFSLRVLGEFLYAQLLPYIIVYFAFGLLGDSVGMGGIGPVVFALISAMILSSIVEKLRQLGVPIPQAVMTLISKPTPPVAVGH